MSDAPAWNIPLSDLDFGAEESAAVQRVIASKWLSMGPEVRAFEEEFAVMQGACHALTVSNATAGLHLALLALGIGPGDEVIQPALNFVAAANMTVAVGATPVFGDIVSLSEPTLDPAEAERLLTPRTKAVVVMHYGGDLCRMADFAALCRGRGIALIEDACHAVGAAYHDPQGLGRWPHGVLAGSIGDIGVFSFFANKNLPTGEGGMVVTQRDDLAERLRLLRSHGMTSLTWDRHKGHAQSYEVVLNGYNYRLDELHAALGRAQLAKLQGNNRRRRAFRALYFQRLRSLAGWELPFAAAPGEAAGHLMVAVASDPETRTRAAQALRDARIQSSMHYPCVSDFEAFARWRTESVARTRQFSSRGITLPLFPTMTEEMVGTVASVLEKASASTP